MSINGGLAAILGRGWLPARAWDDPVIWRRRGHNAIADALANHTMNTQKSWFDVLDWPFPGHTLEDCNLLVHSDGGTRLGRCSASAWVVEACHDGQGGWSQKPIAMGI